MIVAVALQLVGVILVCAGAYSAFGVAGPLVVAGVVLFAAGVVREHTR